MPYRRCIDGYGTFYAEKGNVLPVLTEQSYERDNESHVDVINEYAARVPLIDQHAHSVYGHEPSDEEFQEAVFLDDDAWPDAIDRMRSQFGYALLRDCFPLLRESNGSSTGVSSADYLKTRHAFVDAHSETVLDRKFLRLAGVSTWIIDSGFAAESLHGPEELETLVDGTVKRLTRIEVLAESVLSETEHEPERFIEVFRQRLRESASVSVGFKSIAAYRTGFALSWLAIDEQQVTQSVKNLDALGRHRLVDPVIEAFIVREATILGLPVQFHVGVGDADTALAECNPSHLVPLIRWAKEHGSPIVLLHCVPYEREAAFLCSVHANVYMDVSLSNPHMGAQVGELLREVLAWCPFDKLLYASDGIGLAELHYLASVLFRRHIAQIAVEWVHEGVWTERQAIDVIDGIAQANARRVYGL